MERSRKIGFLLKSSEFFPNSTSTCCSRNFRTPTCSGWIITLWSRIHLLRSPAMFLPPVQIPSKINSAWLILVWGEILPQTVLIKWVDENKKKKTPFTNIIQHEMLDHVSSQLLRISRLQKPPGSNVAVWDPPRWTWALFSTEITKLKASAWWTWGPKRKKLFSGANWYFRGGFLLPSN